jgi:3-oxoacyl-[acyl-carrier protein] reductase
MRGKVVYVTGGGRGIGKAIALAFARAGAVVAISARTAVDLKQTAAEIRAEGGVCDAYQLDVRDSGAVQEAVSDIIEKRKRIDVLIANAGIYGPIGPFGKADPASWKETIDVNLIGTYNAINSVVPHMKKQGHGTIITMAGAGVGGRPKPNLSAYTASKFAICGFTEALSLELKEHGIQVNAIAPGAVNTLFLDQILEAGESAGKEFYEASMKQKETGGTPPEKAAQLCLFLCSEAGKGITGKLISAVRDDYNDFGNKKDGLARSLFTLRRIDGNLFTEK